MDPHQIDSKPDEQPKNTPPVQLGTLAVNTVTQPNTPIPTQPTSTSSSKPDAPRNAKNTLLILALLSFVFTGLPLILLISVGGQTGSEFIGLLLIPVLAIGSIIAIISSIIGIRFLIKYRSKKKVKILCIIFTTISVLYVLVPGIGIINSLLYLTGVDGRQAKEMQAIEENNKQPSEEDTKPKVIDIAKAKDLLSTCQISKFYIMPNKSLNEQGVDAEKSSTGILLEPDEVNPWRISIAQRLKAELSPIAEQAKAKCGNPAVYYDESS